ncbi:hypothetical protein CC80DRAFT_420174 [Byssothecium circinans]|uniref:Tachykinin family protein n=1 Tax=Byssothecium circinans TaxID=147558 RepID=A0A6A5TLX1_9PLEO|nr:hypothetical protein CC80DRAFT_420174 [Byssothecium circinans]
MREADATPSSRPRSSRKSTSPTSANNEPKPPANDLLFITGTTPADFKTKKNMTRVRKKAMGSWLEKEKKPRDSKKEQRRQSREASTCSRAIQKVSRIPPVTGEFVLPSAPIVIPSRETLALPYYEYIPGPFQSIGKPLDPFVTIYQVSHPRVSVETLKYHCTQAFGSRAMGRYWVPALVKSPHAFLSTLCIASAHFDAINDRAIESVQTMALRQEIIHLISQSLLNPQTRTNDFNVIAVTQLIASELIAGQETALAYHEAGLETMVYQRGGLNKLAALLTHLRTALQSSDLVECWSDMAGVLLWISLTVGAASRYERNQVLRKWFRAMTMRVSIVLCFEHPQAMLGTLGRMGEVVEAVGYAENASGSAGVGASVSVNGVEKRGEKKREAGPSKRRRA